MLGYKWQRDSFVNSIKMLVIKCKGVNFCIPLIISRYKFKLEYYNFRILPVIIKITKNKIDKQYTQKQMRK